VPGAVMPRLREPRGDLNATEESAEGIVVSPPGGMKARTEGEADRP